jgi:predicted GIY-YIG superfamily endonuclease
LQKSSVILSEGEVLCTAVILCEAVTALRSSEPESKDLVSFPDDSQEGWTYIVSSHSRCLYIGVTSDLHGRVWEHKNGIYQGFTKKYKIDQLVYHEFFQDIESAIAREKQLKG